MVELKDEEDGRVALIMDKEELPFAVEALMRVGYGLTSPRDEGADEPEEPEAELDEADEPEEEAEEPGRQSPVRRRGSRARRLRAGAAIQSRIRRRLRA